MINTDEMKILESEDVGNERNESGYIDTIYCGARIP